MTYVEPEASCELPCCAHRWAAFERMLAAVQIMCPHDHGTVMVTRYRVEEQTSSGPQVVTYLGNETETGHTFHSYSVNAHVKTDDGFRQATPEEIEGGESEGLLSSGEEPRWRRVATCPRPSCSARVVWTEPLAGHDVNPGKIADRMFKLLDYYGEAMPGSTVQVVGIDSDAPRHVALTCTRGMQ